MQILNNQVEAALAQGLSFKDRFRTSDSRRATAESLGRGDSGGDDDGPGSSGSAGACCGLEAWATADEGRHASGHSHLHAA